MLVKRKLNRSESALIGILESYICVYCGENVIIECKDGNNKYKGVAREKAPFPEIPEWNRNNIMKQRKYLFEKLDLLSLFVAMRIARAQPIDMAQETAISIGGPVFS